MDLLANYSSDEEEESIQTKPISQKKRPNSAIGDQNEPEYRTEKKRKIEQPTSNQKSKTKNLLQSLGIQLDSLKKGSLTVSKHENEDGLGSLLQFSMYKHSSTQLHDENDFSDDPSFSLLSKEEKEEIINKEKGIETQSKTTDENNNEQEDFEMETNEEDNYFKQFQLPSSSSEITDQVAPNLLKQNRNMFENGGKEEKPEIIASNPSLQKSSDFMQKFNSLIAQSKQPSKIEVKEEIKEEEEVTISNYYPEQEESDVQNVFQPSASTPSLSLPSNLPQHIRKQLESGRGKLLEASTLPAAMANEPERRRLESEQQLQKLYQPLDNEIKKPNSFVGRVRNQLSHLAYDAQQRELDNAERRNRGNQQKTLANTKYGWRK